MRLNRTMLDVVLAVLLLVVVACASQSAGALTLTDVHPDGSQTVGTVGDSFAVQWFQGNYNTVNIADAATGRVFRVMLLSFSDKDGNVFTLGQDGTVYRNGLRLVNSAGTPMMADRVLKVGTELFARGKSDQKIWRWNGSATVNAWVIATNVDPTIFNMALPAPVPAPVPSTTP